MLGLPDQAVIRTITVLVIACPHALGLAIPLVVAIATERAARGGVLVKDRLALESMRTVDTVLFDKTGTLTKGQPPSSPSKLPPAAATTKCSPSLPVRSSTRSTRWPEPSLPPHSSAASAAPGERLHVLTRSQGHRHCQRTPGAVGGPSSVSTEPRAWMWLTAGEPTARSSSTFSPTVVSSAP